ncbi:MAG: hypothetical protein WDN04_01120 [Rhodospirillales bacterium]
MRISILSAMSLVTMASAASAQTATPRLQDADINARGGHLSIVRLPIDIGGKTVYRDITLDFKVDANGDVSIATNVKQPSSAAPTSVAPTTISPLIVSKPSPPPVVQNYVSGTYRALDGTAYHLSGHGKPIFGSDLPEWQLSVLGTGGKVLDGATWYDGRIDESKLRRRLRLAGITSESLSWGLSDGGNGVGFDGGALIGATAVGKTLTIYSFRKGCCTDAPEATHAISFELISAD